MPEAVRRGKYRIDFHYGRPGKTTAIRDDGYGTSHIHAKHLEDESKLPVTLARGTFHAHQEPGKIYAVNGDHVAILANQPRGDGGKSVTRLGLTTHFKDAKTAQAARAGAVLLEGR